MGSKYVATLVKTVILVINCRSFESNSFMLILSYINVIEQKKVTGGNPHEKILLTVTILSRL